MKNIKENNVDETTNGDVIEKNKNSQSTLIMITIIICITAVLGSIIWIFGFNKNKNLTSTKSNTEKNNIKYTDSVSVKSEGVYITDVSEVVDQVMPSIVAITSKTIVSSGRFGPYYYGNDEYTTEGAGSGVIVAEDDKNIYILTNYHVVENTNELTITFINEESCDATLKGVSERKDIAIVSVNKKDIDK